MTIARLFLVAVCATSASPSFAQVIEIDADGDAIFHVETTVFAAEGSSVASERSALTVQPLSHRAAPNISVEDVERQYGLPAGMVNAVMYQESRGRMDAVSPKGALGLMQLMPGTAAQLGVNPYDPVQNIHGGARYLRQQIDRFGSIPLALAAYNAGPGAVLRFGGIPPYRETQNYVASIMSRWQPPSPSAVTPAAIKAVQITPTNNDNEFFIEVTEP